MQPLFTLAALCLSRLRALAVTLACLVSVTSGLMAVPPMAYAANRPAAAPSADQVPVDQVMATEPREQAYEEALEVIDDPNGVQKTYEENLKQYRQENPDQGGLVEEAKDLIDKITPGGR
jgi:hypothetical protein